VERLFVCQGVYCGLISSILQQKAWGIHFCKPSLPLLMPKSSEHSIFCHPHHLLCLSQGQASWKLSLVIHLPGPWDQPCMYV